MILICESFTSQVRLNEAKRLIPIKVQRSGDMTYLNPEKGSGLMSHSFKANEDDLKLCMQRMKATDSITSPNKSKGLTYKGMSKPDPKQGEITVYVWKSKYPNSKEAMEALLKRKKVKEASNNLNQNFDKWFGNSKVVDSSGNPLVVYHGTDKVFDTFDREYIASNTGNYGHYGYGLYFSDDIREAKTYGNSIMKVYLKMEKPFYNTLEYLEPYLEEWGGIVKEPVAIDSKWLIDAIIKIDPIAGKLASSIEKHGYSDGWSKFLDTNNYREEFPETILDLNTISDWFEYIDPKSDKEISQYYIDEIEKELGQKPKVHYNYTERITLLYLTDHGINTGITDQIRKDGYDGIIAGSEYIIFDPNHIKSVENNGDWSNSDNIYEKLNKGKKEGIK